MNTQLKRIALAAVIGMVSAMTFAAERLDPVSAAARADAVDPCKAYGVCRTFGLAQDPATDTAARDGLPEIRKAGSKPIATGPAVVPAEGFQPMGVGPGEKFAEPAFANFI
jgi:hypothetical protein